MPPPTTTALARSIQETLVRERRLLLAAAKIPPIVDAATAVERVGPGRRARFEALTSGITNRNFRVEVDGAAYVLRIGGQDTELLGIDRVAEHAASLGAAEVGVGPGGVALVQPEGWLVTHFIDGRRRPGGGVPEAAGVTGGAGG